MNLKAMVVSKTTQMPVKCWGSTSDARWSSWTATPCGPVTRSRA